jgi:translation elongation factor EF-1beta
MAAPFDLAYDEMSCALSFVLMNAGAAQPAAAPKNDAAAPKKEAAAPKKEDKKEAPKPKPKDEDDDMDDMFGDDDEDEVVDAAALKAAKDAKVKAAKDAVKVVDKKVDRTQCVFEIKPWDAELSLDDLAAKIKATQFNGLTWGEAHKLVPVAFGIKKLVVSCIVIDELVALDDVTDLIEGFSDEVQSVDLATMNRL